MESLENIESHQALQIAFQIMKERCHQLQGRLLTLEEENLLLRSRCDHHEARDYLEITNENDYINNLHANISELKRQKSVLGNHIAMVASENRQLWRRLTSLAKTNTLPEKSAQNLETHNQSCEEPSPEIVFSLKEKTKDNSLEEVLLQLVDNRIVKDSFAIQQSNKLLDSKKDSAYSLNNMGYTYPENISADSLNQLKQHEIKLSQIKNALSSQQTKLKTALKVIKNKKSNQCSNCKNSSPKIMLQVGTQFEQDQSSKEHEETQTSIAAYNFVTRKSLENLEEEQICPICGNSYTKLTFELFHDHVVNHFTSNLSNSFEMVT